MPRFYPNSIFHFSEDKHVAEVEHNYRQAAHRIVSQEKTGTQFYSGDEPEPAHFANENMKDHIYLNCRERYEDMIQIRINSPVNFCLNFFFIILSFD